MVFLSWTAEFPLRADIYVKFCGTNTSKQTSKQAKALEASWFKVCNKSKLSDSLKRFKIVQGITSYLRVCDTFYWLTGSSNLEVIESIHLKIQTRHSKI
jgi:hypothetical protein